ncbi:MAG: TolC family protein [Saprospiraceae bacterium]
MKKYIKLLLLLIYTTSMQSQSLDSLMEMAIKNHPSITVADLKIKQQELLRGSGFELQPTDFYYLGQALGYENDNRQHDFGVRQSFELPKVYKAKNALIEAETELLKQERVLTEVELKKVVANLYWQVVTTYQQQQLFDAYDSVYTDFLKLAALRVETGETSKIEFLRVENSQKNWRIQQNEADRNYELAQGQLAYLLGREDWIDVKNVQLQQLSMNLPEVNAVNHPLMQYYEQQKNVATQQAKIEENALSPTFHVGYASQIFDGNAGLNLIEIGVGIPLHRKPQQQRIEAAKANASIIQAKAETDKFLLENEWKLALANLETLNGQIFSIDRLLMNNLLETVGLAKAGYEGGELPYFEYLATIEQVLEAEMKKFDLIQKYNETVILINYGFGIE